MIKIGGYALKITRLFLRLICLLIVFSLLPAVNAAPEDLPAGAGQRRLEGGQRDFLWPVPDRYNLTSCFIDNRDHYSLDIDGEEGDPVVASYAGTVISIFDTCSHNYYKEEQCCSSWGNYVLLQHDYELADGSTVTLYSRYAHLTKVQVAVEDTVEAGQQIGTVGTTGNSRGTHLDYEILYGNTGPSETYSVDPYINELLVLPAQLYTTQGGHCQEYVSYVKNFYTVCKHESYNAVGNCTSCGEAFNWQSTRRLEKMGLYTATPDTLAMSSPYIGADGEPLPDPEHITVGATVNNSLGEIWYEIDLGNGRKGYAPQNALTLDSYFNSNLQGSLTSLREGQVLSSASHRLEGTVSSAYPLRKVTAYLDDNAYATWTGTGEVYEVRLRNTDINRELDFATMSPGDHTLMITAADSTGRKAVTVITCNFVIEAPVTEPEPTPEPDPDPEPEPEPEEITITFVASSGTQTAKQPAGHMLGKLPVPTRTTEALYFVGWFTAEEGGKMVTPYTVPDADMTLYARWSDKTQTVLFDKEKMIVAHGAYLSELPEPTKEGYRFIGWYTDYGEKMTTYMTITSDVQLHSRWEACRYTVTLDPNGGTVEKDSFEVTFDEMYGKLPKPKREGYVFLGWQLGNRAITENIEVETARDHTLKALWRVENPTKHWLIPVLILAPISLAAVCYGIIQWRRERDSWKSD